MPSFLDRLAERTVLLADGATGTNYQNMGIEPGLAPEEWIFDAPDRVQELHRRFVEAGSDLVLTCTFGATTPRLADGPLAGRTSEVNARAAELAREAAGGDRLVAGSLGPTGLLVEPYGVLTRETAVGAYAEQARALADGGVDLLVLETFFALEEALWAIEGVQKTTDLPLVASFSFDQGTHTMMGLQAAQVAQELTALGVDVVGINCGRSLEENLTNLRAMRAATHLPIWMKPNAGLPRMTDDDVAIYDVTPEAMGEAAARWAQEGAQIIGGCCGTSPDHLREIARAAQRVTA